MFTYPLIMREETFAYSKKVISSMENTLSGDLKNIMKTSLAFSSPDNG